MTDNELVAKYQQSVRCLAFKLHTHSTVYDIDDLYQEGLIGLLAAWRNYDSSLDCTFWSYAQHRVQGRMLDYIRRSNPLPRLVCSRQKVVNRIIDDHRKQYGQDPTLEELWEYLPQGEQKKILRDAKLAITTTQFSDADSLGVDDSPCNVVDIIDYLEHCLSSLSPRESDILRSLVRGESFREIAERYHFSRQYASTLSKQIRIMLRRRFAREYSTIFEG